MSSGENNKKQVFANDQAALRKTSREPSKSMVTLYFAPRWIFTTNKYAELNAKGFQMGGKTLPTINPVNIFIHCHSCFLFALLKIIS